MYTIAPNNVQNSATAESCQIIIFLVIEMTFLMIFATYFTTFLCEVQWNCLVFDGFHSYVSKPKLLEVLSGIALILLSQCFLKKKPKTYAVYYVTFVKDLSTEEPFHCIMVFFKWF